MTDSGEDLSATAQALFRRVSAQITGRSLCHPVARTAAAWARKLDEPMRVAVAGEIKLGKSTLVNALVAADAALTVSDNAQDHAVATGQLETTYVLTELTYGSPPGIRVEYQDKPSVTAPLSELHAYTRRRDHSGDLGLDGIDRVVVTLDAPMLRRFRLIDTPGFNSVYGTDAAASLTLLTRRGLTDADAVIYTIGNEGLSSISRDVAQQFLGQGAEMTPFKAIGVMPRANQLWPVARARAGASASDSDTDPLRWARREIDAMRPGGGREMFHAIVPVAGILGEAAALACDDDFVMLRELTSLKPSALASALTAGAPSRMFASRPDFPLATKTRERLVKTFSPWGVYTAVQIARDCESIPEVRRLLDQRSGVAGLRDLVGNHFGQRAGTVRVRDALTELTYANRLLRLRLPAGSVDHLTLVAVGRDLERFEQAHAVMFWQLGVLGEYYRNEMTLGEDQIDDLLRLTGECGGCLPARLGLPPGASSQQLRAAAAAAARRWAAVSWGGRNQAVAQMMTRIIDAIQHQLRTGEC